METGFVASYAVHAYPRAVPEASSWEHSCKCTDERSLHQRRIVLGVNDLFDQEGMSRVSIHENMCAPASIWDLVGILSQTEFAEEWSGAINTPD